MVSTTVFTFRGLAADYDIDGGISGYNIVVSHTGLVTPHKSTLAKQCVDSVVSFNLLWSLIVEHEYDVSGLVHILVSRGRQHT